MVAMKDLTGQVFGRLTVKARLQNENGRLSWYCVCSCGGFKIIDSKALVTGKTASCGCLRIKHGLSKSHPLYPVWLSMRDRCNNPNNNHYQYYGAKGIGVCEQWNDFTMFIEDMGPRPPGKSIERNNLDIGYEPTNCKWATDLEQMNNTTRNRWITVDGTTKTITDWSRTVGGSTSIIHTRLRNGWSERDACLTPVRVK